MDVLWFIYDMGMLALLTIGMGILVTSAFRASQSDLPLKDIALASFGIALFGGALVYWINGTPQISVEIPRWYLAFGTIMVGYGGHGIMLWSLNPALAKKLTG